MICKNKQCSSEACCKANALTLCLQDDRVIEVLRCHQDRVVLLTSAHVALLACTSKPQDKFVTYKSKWTLRLHDVQNVRGRHSSPALLLASCHVYGHTHTHIRLLSVASSCTPPRLTNCTHDLKGYHYGCLPCPQPSHSVYHNCFLWVCTWTALRLELRGCSHEAMLQKTDCGHRQ